MGFGSLGGGISCGWRHRGRTAGRCSRRIAFWIERRGSYWNGRHRHGGWGSWNATRWRGHRGRRHPLRPLHRRGRIGQPLHRQLLLFPERLTVRIGAE